MASRSALLLLVIMAAGAFANPESRKVFSRCELHQWLRAHGSTMPNTWTCIAFYESSYNTAARGGPNSNGSYDHGLWQVNDNYWCDDNVGLGNDCNIACAKLRDDDITDDWECVQFIQARQGFGAWSTWPRCDNAENESSWSEGC